ncbi:uncharacterized protein LOC142895546 [Nelusetta ayraudi]|uniref:uncharacterized protein LOC142895546 n=1 Tax=Nelusetta ayraudi TaxID=303726 RepID=UPI003F702DA4
MPRMTVFNAKHRGGATEGVKGGWDLGPRWMEETSDGVGGVAAVEWSQLQSSSYETPAAFQSQQTARSLMPGVLHPCTEWYSFALVGVVLSICQAEAPLHPYLLLAHVFWRLLLLCLLWLAVGSCIHVLRSRLWRRPKQGEPEQRFPQEAVAQNRNNQYTRMSQPMKSGHSVPVGVALADSLLVCVLQEPLSDADVPHLKSLFSRLQLVSQTLQDADVFSAGRAEALPHDSALTDKAKLIHAYLQRRMESLAALVQVQQDFEASVKDMLEGISGLWARLEVLHTGVTLTKHWGQGHKDLASAWTDLEALSSAIGLYSSRLQGCQNHLKDSMEVLQELTWSYTHASSSVSRSSESVWPELLLQANIEQFDKVQESFFSLEQQTSTFQAHLEGLGKGTRGGLEGPVAQSKAVQPPSVLKQASNVSAEHRIPSTSESTSASSAHPDSRTSLSLRERSALHFSSALGRLRRSGRRK